MIPVIDEDVILTIVDRIVTDSADIIAQIESERTPIGTLPYLAVTSEFVEPEVVEDTPVCSVTFLPTVDAARDRALDQSKVTVIITSFYRGTFLMGYRYNAAICALVYKDRRFGCKFGNCTVKSREYYKPILRGDEELKICSTTLEITQEVVRR